MAVLALLAPALASRGALISSPPKSQNVAAGLNATFTVTASGYPLTYQWRYEGVDLPGATTNTLRLTNVQPANAGAYQAVVRGPTSSETSAVAVLVVGRVAVWLRTSGLAALTNLPLALTNVVGLELGGGNGLARRADGTVLAWGDNSYGQTNVPAGLSNVVALAANAHCLALSSDGTVTAWGSNTHGQTNVPAGLSNVVGIAAGSDQSLALRADGKIVNWGQNWGSCQAPNGFSAVAVTAGSSHYVALTSAGMVKAWGGNSAGQLSVPAGLSGVVAISAGANHTLALKGDGTVAAWGQNTAGQCTVPANATNVVALAAGGNSSLVLCGDGTVVGWGANTSGQLDPPAGFTNVIAMAGSGILGLRNFGEPVPARSPVTLTNWAGQALSLYSSVVGCAPLTYQWQHDGRDIPGATNPGLTFAALQPADTGVYQIVVANAVGVVTGQVATVTVQPQVSVAAWGLNGDGQCDVPAGLSNLVAIAAGAGRTLVLRDNGTVMGWGASGGYQSLVPANLTNAIAIAMGDNHNLALKADGTLAAWGTPSSSMFTNTSLATLQGFVAIASAASYNLGIKREGTVYGWADSFAGPAPTSPPAGLTGVKAIAAGYQHALALKSDGTVVAWGSDTFGQTDIPPGLTNVQAIASGLFHSVALKGDGTVVVWGDNRFDQTNMPAGLANVVKISASSYHTVAVKADGTVVAWGNNRFSQSLVPAGLTNVVAVAGGSYHNVALVTQPAPCVTEPPRSQMALPGATATFQVTCTGLGPLGYQWRFNGTDLAGATNASLTITNVQSAQAGPYTVVISNALGSVVSPEANLTIGPLVAWGDNSLGQAWIPAGLDQPAAVSAGGQQTAVLETDGTLVNWGSPYAPPAGLPVIAAVALSTSAALALGTDGSVTGWGNEVSGQVSVPAGLTGLKAVALGMTHALGLRADGTVVAWGNPALNFGQTNVPAGLDHVVAIAAGDDHSLALRADGTVVGWGHAPAASIPAGLSNVVAIAAGSVQSLALCADGTIVSWGSSTYGLNTPPADATNIVAIAAGGSTDIAVKADGTLRVWGSGGYGQLNVPAGLARVRAVSAGWGHIVAWVGDGRPYITVQPVDQAAAPGGTAAFNVMAAGDPTLSYQWQVNGVDVAGATGPALALTGVSAGMAGLYRCIVSNALGVAVSQPAKLQVAGASLRFEGPTAAALDGNGLRLKLTGLMEAGPIVLYRSTNLVDWEPVVTNAPVMGTWEYVAPLTGAGQLFYRASELH